jgi:predicted secreted hydrolase
MRIHIKLLIYLIVFNIVIISGCGPNAGSGAAGERLRGESSRLSELLRDDGNPGFPRVTRVRNFAFPEDHGPHPAYRNEWWYFTGNLDAEGGRRFGYELTIFRFSLSPDFTPGGSSSWETNQVYIGHLALTDVENGDFHVAQRYSRGAAGLAGATAEPFRVWLDDWSVSGPDAGTGDSWSMQADDGRFGIDLVISPQKPIVLNGDRGLSQKSAEPGNASYYYSIPRLQTRGNVIVDGSVIAVTGSSWLDREWGSSALARDQQGWDWFALQLSDGSDLMFYVLRGMDGAPDSHSSGTWTDADGDATHLRLGDVEVEVTDFWDSERGGRYPSAWTIRVPSRQVSLLIRPVLENQELTTNVRYWEGAVDISGTSGNEPISGRGYVELTGYASD